MPDMPMPAQGAQEEKSEGGGAAEKLAAAGQLLEEVANGVAGDGQVPDEVKQLFAASLDAYKQGFEALTGGGSAPAAANASPEQGASGAQPMSMQRPR